jgi:septum formation protein
MTLVLASASPRRRHLLEQAGIDIDVVPAHVDEAYLEGESPSEHVMRLAHAKAATVAAKTPSRCVLGADTVVVMDGRIYGKPRDLDEAHRFLAAFSGRTHEVLTGVCLVRPAPAEPTTWVSRSVVHFRHLTAKAIDEYCRIVNALDKAGAYGIQEHGELIVERVEGLVSNVIGLPIEDVLQKLTPPAG